MSFIKVRYGIEAGIEGRHPKCFYAISFFDLINHNHAHTEETCVIICICFTIMRTVYSVHIHSQDTRQTPTPADRHKGTEE